MDDAGIRDAPGFLEGGGELGRLIAGFDWSATPLGPIVGWPASLRAVVAMALRAPVPIALFVGRDGILLYNDAYRAIAGPRHPGILGLPVRDGWPEVAAFNDDVIRTVLAGGSLSFRDQELTLRRKGLDEQVWLDLDYSPIVDDAGRPGGVIVYVTETTGRVMFERAVAGERERLRQMFEQAPSFMALLRGPEHVFDLANAAYLQLIGHRDVIGKPVREALPDVAGQGYFELLERVYASGERFIGSGTTVSLQRTPGAVPEERIVDFVYHPIRGGDGQVVGIFVQGIDITERIIAERALRESEAQLRIFAESMPNHVWAARPDGWIDWYNNRVYEYLGARPGDLDGERWATALHPDDRAEAWRRWSAAIAGGAPYEAEFRLRRADGAWRRHIARAVLIRDEAGRPTRWIGTNTDIEDQSRIEQALRDSELRLRLSQQAAGIASLEVDIATERVFGSDNLWPLWGLPPAESVEIGVLEALVVPEDRHIRSNPAHAQRRNRGPERRIPHPSRRYRRAALDRARHRVPLRPRTAGR